MNMAMATDMDKTATMDVEVTNMASCMLLCPTTARLVKADMGLVGMAAVDTEPMGMVHCQLDMASCKAMVAKRAMAMLAATIEVISS